MRAKLLSLVLCPLLLALSLGGCAYDPTAGVGGNAANFWNSPAVQTTLQGIEAAAAAFLQGWMSSHLSASPGSRAAEDATVAHLKKLYPNVPDTVLIGAARKAAEANRAP